MSKQSTTQMKVMASSNGCPMMQPRYSLTAGATGPTLMEDVELFDKVQHFDREQLAPRNVHALGVGAFGTFKPTNDVSKYTCAKLFSKDAGETKVFARFSGVFTGREEPETIRDMRGFALKFYTGEGIWDLLTVNIPCFGVSDAKSGPDTIHAMKRDPRTGEWNTDTVWDFTVTHEEGLHQAILLLLDQYGTPNSYRNMHGFSCNTFSFMNKDGAKCWIRFHLVPELPPGGLNTLQAKLIAGEEPDFLRKDLRRAIERGEFPEWKLAFQTMTEEEGYKNDGAAFDPTRYWCTKSYPLIELGVIQMNENPTDHWFQTEQVAFSPSNVVPGIGFSPDRLLQGRLFIYPDTQFHRLGPNYKQIPINCPINQSTASTPYYGGPHRHIPAAFPPYYPSLMGGLAPLDSRQLPQSPRIQCEQAGYFVYDDSKGPSHFDQIRETIKNHPNNNLALNIARSLSKVTQQEVVNKSIELLKKVDQALVEEIEAILSKIKGGDQTVLSEGQILLSKLQAKPQI